MSEVVESNKADEMNYISKPLPFVNTKARRNRQLIVVAIVCLVLIGIAAILISNHKKINDAAEQLSENLKGKIFEDIEYNDELKLYDPIKKRRYEFQGAKSTFSFNENKTVTWTRQYVRLGDKKELTEPVTTTETYTVNHYGGLIYNENKLNLRLSNGDILYILYSGDFVPDEVNYYSQDFMETYNAPSELANIETSELNKPRRSSTATSSHLPSRTKCNVCNGSGLVRYYYGGSALEAALAGQSDYTHGTCYHCKGTGYIYD